ncbi:unnamed protein product, partial [Sphacelaria rigidula]
VAPFLTSTSARTPSPPESVSVSIISGSELGVSWTTPASDGGATVTRY